MNRIIGLMKQYHISPVKRLGQNFLTDENMLKKLKEAINPTPGDYIIEIGPGLGSLTEELAGNCSVLYCVELDTKLYQVINDRFGHIPGFLSGNFDIMDLNAKEPLPGYKEGYKVKITGNLPYYITTPIIMKFLEEDFQFDSMYFMMQKEVADRITAKPGTKDYGALTVAVNYYCKAEQVLSVPPHSFCPQPNVHSTFLELVKRPVPIVDVKSKDLFFKVVRGAFHQRRKTLVNALSNYPGLDAGKEELQTILESMGLDADIRGERLNVDQLADLSNRLFKE